MKNNLSDNLLVLRENKNMTWNQLASKVGIQHNMIKKYEEGKIMPSLDVLINLCESLKCDPNTLINTKVNDNLLSKLSQVESLPEDKKKMIHTILDEFIEYDKLQQQIIGMVDLRHKKVKL